MLERAVVQQVRLLHRIAQRPRALPLPAELDGTVAVPQDTACQSENKSDDHDPPVRGDPVEQPADDPQDEDGRDQDCRRVPLLPLARRLPPTRPGGDTAGRSAARGAHRLESETPVTS
ncbi:hypothetical protein AB0387_24010 [Streptomyces sp. NPDC089173]|uniref:hypothetical protein n=1 Tax=Streptomyces sp. NPDC089173 TaxID=3154965 RepID=UPI003450E3E3